MPGEKHKKLTHLRLGKLAGITFISLFCVALLLLFFQPRFLLDILGQSSSNVIFYIETTEPQIALTIDDGPDPNYTSEILDCLSENEVKATFFLISSHVTGNETLVKRIVEEGHEIGNHNMRDETSIELTSEEFSAQLTIADSVLSQYGTLKWYRPGGGFYNYELLREIKKLHYKCVLGSVYPYDVLIPSDWFAIFHILINVRPGSIIILHDGSTRGERTLEVLQTILPRLKKKGFRFVTLSELSKSRRGL